MIFFSSKCQGILILILLGIIAALNEKGWPMKKKIVIEKGGIAEIEHKREITRNPKPTSDDYKKAAFPESVAQMT